MKNINLKFQETFGYSNDLKHFFCHGRLTLIGEHIDNLGRSDMQAVVRQMTYEFYIANKLLLTSL